MCVDDDLEAARAAVRGAVARRAMNSYGRLARLGQLDADDLEALTRLEREYDTRQHGLAGQVLSDLVPERWIDRFAIVGPPDRVRSRIEQAIAQGADEVSMILMGPNPNERGGAQQLHRFAETVLAHGVVTLRAIRTGSGEPSAARSGACAAHRSALSRARILCTCCRD